MAYEVILSPAAETDLLEILDYMEHTLEAQNAMKSFLADFDEISGHLEQYPQMFELSRDPGLRARGYHKFLIGKYAALYLINEAKSIVYIARIFHGTQNYPKYL